MAILPTVNYDLCALTGDYRGQTFGPYDAALAGMSRICGELKRPIYGVLGNHDTIRMLPSLEKMGIRMLLNECETIERAHQRIHLAGIDDAHFYRADNLEKAASGYRVASSRSFFRTRRRFIGRLLMLSSTSC